MEQPISQKTVFVLDHTLTLSSGVDVDMESLCKTRGGGGSALHHNHIPLRPVTKTIWTCAVEAITEYCRIVWDIFPGSRFVRFTSVGGANVDQLTSWHQDQCLSAVMQVLMWSLLHGILVPIASHPAPRAPASRPPAPRTTPRPPHCALPPALRPAPLHPTPRTSFFTKSLPQNLLTLGAARRGTPDLLAGCLSALQDLTRPSPPQHQQNASQTPIVNKGRVIVVTKLHSNQEAKLYYQKFCELVGNVNRSLKEDDLPISHVHLVLLSFVAKDEPSHVTNGSLNGGGSGVSGDVVEFQCGSSVAAKLCSLVVRHYNLASTTVTGIPMKEEQNALSSANYDVELFHPAEAHAATLGDESIRTTRQNTDYPTVTLKWCTPRTNASHELHQCSSAFRITSVDVNSRPSSCLTNFLLNGRWVMLESPKRTAHNHSTRILSHMLAAHGGDIYIHTLLTARTVLEDPPSISEGTGGKVTDYRIPDFAQFIRANVLAPYGAKGNSLSKAQLDKHTKHWPITHSQTALFSLGPTIEPLSRAIVQEQITEEQIFECKQVIINLINMEVQGENLNTSHARTKGSKKEEQYRAMWQELEHFLREHNCSANHQKVLDCYLQCHDKDPNVITIGQDTPKEESVGIDQALEEMDLQPRKAGRKRRGSNTSTGDTETKKWLSEPTQILARGGQSLLTIFQQKIKSSENKGSPQFVGRLKAENNVTKLYANLQQKEKEDMPSRRK